MLKTVTTTQYLHGIYLSDRLKCQNIYSSGQLHSLKVATMYISRKQADYYTVPLEKMRNNPEQVFDGLINPRAGLLLEAAIIRSGKQLVKFGRKITNKYKEHVLKIAEVELEFERHRRSLDPERQLPSRLTCLFICEDDDHGTNIIRSMLDETNGIYISRVHVPVIPWGYHKADVRWFNAYCKEPKPEYIEKYWAGEAYNSEPTWECLLEGTITFSDDDITNIRLYGSFGEQRQ